MADRNPTDCGDFAGTDYVTETRQAERAVLSFLIDEHPSRLTIPEVARTFYAIPATSRRATWSSGRSENWSVPGSSTAMARFSSDQGRALLRRP